MKKESNNKKYSHWQTSSQDIVIETSNVINNAEAKLKEVKNGNNEFLDSGYFQIESHLLKVLEVVKTNDIKPIAFNRLETLFEKLVKIGKELKTHLNVKSYEEFKEFYSDVNYSLDSEKPVKVIEPNVMRDIYLNKLHNYLEKPKSKSNNIKDKPAYKLGLLIASGKFQECINNNMRFKEIADTYFEGDDSKNTIRTMMSHNTVDKDGSYPTNLKNCIFRPDMYKMEEIIFAIIQECNSKKIPIVDKIFKEYEKILFNKTNS